MNCCAADPSFDPTGCRETVNRWIVGEVRRTSVAVAEAIEAYKFNEAAAALYQFFWGSFCRSEEHTSELQSLMRISYAVFCLKKKNIKYKVHINITNTKIINTITKNILH